MLFRSKQVLALGLAGAVVAGTVGCGSKTNTGNNSGKSTGDSDVVTLKWVAVGSGMPKNYDKWAKKVNEYLGKKIGVNIDMQVVEWGSWSDKRNAIVNTNGDYDILFTNADTYTNDVSTGAFLDLSDLIGKDAPDLKKMVPENYWDACKVNNKIYAIPTYKDSSQSEYVVWDKKKIEAAGYDPAKLTELDQLTEPLQKVTDTDKQPAFPLSSSGATYLTYQYDMMNSGLMALGVKYNDGKGKVVPVFEQDDVMNELKLFHKWYGSGIINSDAATADEKNTYKACNIAQGWPSAAKTTWGPNMGVEATATQWGPTIVSNDTVRGSLNCISANCKHSDKALEFLNLLNTDSYLRDSFYYGLEGDNWKYTDSTKTKVHKNNDNWKMAGYTQGTFFTVTPTDDVDFNQWDEVKKLNENAQASVLLGFTFDTSKVSDQLTNCKTIMDSYKGELLTGTSDPEKAVPAMMKEMRAAGFDDIAKEAQTQVDKFLASKSK